MAIISFKCFVRLLEGGAAGHMSHIFEDPDLTFQELKNILKDVFDGKVKLTQKLDGQNISVTWKNGQIGLARNKATLREPMTIEQTARKFDGRGAIKDAFVNSLKDLQNALKTVDEAKLDEWFQNGQNFLSLEIIYPDTRNVIEYDNCILVIHGMLKYDDKLNPTGELDQDIGQEIYNELNQNDALKQKTFEITGPQVVEINQALDTKALENKTNKLIDEFLKDNNLSGENTIQDYLNTKVPQEKMPKAKQAKLRGEALAPLEDIILRVSAEFLKKLSPFVTSNPDKKIKSLQNELQVNIRDLQKANLTDSEKTRVEKKLEKLEKVGLDNIAPLEGIVFKHKDKVYKLTGAFAPLNQILGILKFK